MESGRFSKRKGIYRKVFAAQKQPAENSGAGVFQQAPAIPKGPPDGSGTSRRFPAIPLFQKRRPHQSLSLPGNAPERERCFSGVNADPPFFSRAWL